MKIRIFSPSLLFLLSFFIALIPALSGQAKHSAQTQSNAKFALTDGWMLQSSARVEQKGEEISTPGFQPNSWHAASVPTIVVAALVKEKIYRDTALVID